MDYEKKYKEAVCNIQKLLENGRKEGEVICAYEADFMSIFPELKESEDEQIRQRIIHALHGDVLEMSEIKEAIDWLEKQGTPAELSEEEQNRFAKCVLSSCALSFIDYLDAHKYEGKMCVSNGECEDIENAFHNAMWDRLHRYYCKYIEKQGETKLLDYDDFTFKPAMEATTEEKVDNANKVEPKDYNDIDPHFGKPIDKVEPKFKVGDWIIFNGLTLYIKEIVKGYYRTISKGGITNSYDWGIDNTARLWTIQDAKPGDVLATKTGGVFIYKEMLYGKPFAYCGVDKFGVFKDCKCGAGRDWTPYLSDVTPATNEQCALLFQKMKEAGYAFDFDKKELKKIEQKPAEWDNNDEYIFNTILHTLDLKKCKFEKEGNSEEAERWHTYYNWMKPLKNRILHQPQQEWSEEDKRNLNWVINVWNRLRRGGDAQTTPSQMEYLENFLKSLKDRVGCEMNCTTTKEWSEEDESKIRHLIAFLDTNPNSVIYSRPKEEWINWLKSLRPRSQWKPSEEQIYELTKAVDYYTSHGFPNKILDELLKQLYNLL